MAEIMIIKNAFLIDGNGGDPISDATVVIEDEKIKDVGQGLGQDPRGNAQVVDLGGKTLMPGLIDAHVHVGNIEVVHDRTVALPPAVYVHRATRNL